MVKSKIFASEKVENKSPRAKADTSYNVVYIELEDGTVVPALFTDFDIQKAVKRAAANAEDVPAQAPVKKNWFKRLFG